MGADHEVIRSAAGQRACAVKARVDASQRIIDALRGGLVLNRVPERAERDFSAAACALIVIDVQHDFCDADGAVGRDVERGAVDAMCTSIATLHAAAHRCGVPVVFVQTVHRDATDSRAWRNRFPERELMVCREGTWGAEFHRCAPIAGDVVVQKHRYSAFHGTELQHVLHTLGRTTVALTGTSTNVCVESDGPRRVHARL